MSEGGAPFTTDDVSMPLSRASSPASTADNTTNIEDPSAPTSPRLDAVVPLVDVDSRRDIRRRWHFFTNTSFYCLIRLVQVLYSRLEAVRKESAALAPIVSRGAASKDGQGKGLSADALYESALALCERLFEDEIEQSVFEDTLRQAFGLKSYIIFTVERLVSAIIKQAQAAIADPRSQELLDLVQQDRSHPDRNTAQQQTAYRQQAEKTLGMDENMYRIEWAPATSTMFIQLLGKDSITSEDSDMFEREWGRYLDDYALAGPTPGVAPVIDPFLKRNMKRVRPDADTNLPDGVVVSSGLQCRVCVRTFRMFAVCGTEDSVYRKRELTTPTSGGAKWAAFEAFREKKLASLAAA